MSRPNPIATAATRPDKKQQVGRMFDDIAPTYDALNHILSIGIDRLWRRAVVEIAATHINSANLRSGSILDIATGTGDLAIAMARKIPSAHITGIDISEKMLEVGRAKVSRFEDARKVTSSATPQIELKTGDAERMEAAAGAFDVVTAAFGVRNFGDIAAGLREMHRVTKPGGKCIILEFSEPNGAIFGRIYRFYFHRILPFVGRLVSRNVGAYSYLPRSVDGFPAPEKFAGMLADAGFSCVWIKKLTLGISYIYTAVKK